MLNKVKLHSQAEAKKIIADYIDQSAIRLSLRLKKEYSAQQKQAVGTKPYAQSLL